MRAPVLDPKLKRTLNFVVDCVAKGYPPTVREIGAAMDYSRQTAVDHLKRLEAARCVKVVPRASRGVRVTKLGMAAIRDPEAQHQPGLRATATSGAVPVARGRRAVKRKTAGKHARLTGAERLREHLVETIEVSGPPALSTDELLRLSIREMRRRLGPNPRRHLLLPKNLSPAR